MSRLVFFIIYPFLWLISSLPFRLFYMLSDLVYLFVYHLAGYRRKTVRENLVLVFPEKSVAERKKIEKKFYHNMVDMFMEMIKTMTISEKELTKRYQFTNVDEVKRIREMDKSIILLYGHYANYEWVNALQFYDTGLQGHGIYKKLKNKYFDRLAHQIRGRFNAYLIPTITATKQVTANEEANKRGIYAFIGDQSPRLDRSWYWTKFMGIKCPTFTGGERLAKRLDMSVAYLHVEKPKRGHYVATFKTIAENATDFKDYEITDQFLRYLEKQIQTRPELYLWTHKRWKHKDKPIPERAMVNF